jgi:hypothetical protein
MAEERALTLAELKEKHKDDPYVEGMPVDLSRGREGICERFGKRWYTFVEPTDDGFYEVRIESGWRQDYYKDGTARNPKSASITFFAPCSRFSPQAEGLPSETRP